jgi:selenocysteine lyase/cysteine desulfurase
MEPLIGKQAFIGLDQCTWLYSGAETPALTGAAEAVQQYMLNRSKGPIGRELNDQVEQQLRANLARILHAAPADIALMSNSSEAIAAIAHSIEFHPGDNVVINSLEFPSGVLPWLTLKEKGVEVRLVDHHDWQISATDMLAKVDGRTRIVVASQVSYHTGARLDCQAIYEKLKKTDTLFLVDATQAAGAVGVDARHADYTVISSYKWLLSVHGLGILALNPERPLPGPDTAGWRSVSDLFSPHRFSRYTLWNDARRFELGYPAYPSVYAMNYSTGLLLNTGLDAIERHILALGGELIEGLTRLGYNVMTPADPAKRAGNISVIDSNGGKLADELSRKQIYVWGGDGRFRVSIHAFNDSNDVAALLSNLPAKVGNP